MKIEKVYCLQMNKIAGVYEVREHFFQNQSGGDLTFYCSSEECLKALIPVIGVNYRYLPEKHIVQNEAHFRTNHKYPHRPNCVWLEIERVREALQETDIDNTGHRRKTKVTNPYELFIPKSSQNGDGDEIFGSSALKTISLTAGAGERRSTIEKYLRHGQSQTTLLENLVICYLNLDKRKQSEKKLSIDRTEKRSFSEVFTHVKNYYHKTAAKHIFYGGVKIKQYGKNFSLTLFDKIIVGDEDKDGAEEKVVSLYIKEEDLKGYKQRAFLTKVLEKLSKENDWATIYFYGKIRNSLTNPIFHEIVLEHYDNLFLKLKS